MKIITTTEELSSIFNQCCEYYDHLEMMVAWVGDPGNHLPFDYLIKLKSISAVVGTDFNQTSPDGLNFLKDNKAVIRIVENNQARTFHPKIFIFSKGNEKTMLIGSSNFTYMGFNENIEANVFLEGKAYRKEIEKVSKFIDQWKKSGYSIPFSSIWFKEYKAKYKLRIKQIKNVSKKDEAFVEETFSKSPAWIGKAEWSLVFNKVADGLKRRGSNDRISDLELYSKELKYPFSLKYFKDSEKRKMIWGERNQYDAYGNVGAKGTFKGLIKSGPLAKQNIVIKAINNISKLNHPLDCDKLRTNLNTLTKLGFTMKVWGRLLAITRPDLFCTVSSENVRVSLAEVLNKPHKYFETVDGYIALIKLIHRSPWFNSKKPISSYERKVWDKRVALIDVILY